MGTRLWIARRRPVPNPVERPSREMDLYVLNRIASVAVTAALMVALACLVVRDRETIFGRGPAPPVRAPQGGPQVQTAPRPAGSAAPPARRSRPGAGQFDKYLERAERRRQAAIRMGNDQPVPPPPTPSEDPSGVRE